MNHGETLNQKCGHSPTISGGPVEEKKIAAALSYADSIDNQHCHLNEELYQIIGRLDCVANRINPSEYPKNIPSKNTVGDPGNDSMLKGAPVRPDGILGLIIDNNERSQGRLNLLLQHLVPEINAALNYIESHI